MFGLGYLVFVRDSHPLARPAREPGEQIATQNRPCGLVHSSRQFSTPPSAP